MYVYILNGRAGFRFVRYHARDTHDTTPATFAASHGHDLNQTSTRCQAWPCLSAATNAARPCTRLWLGAALAALYHNQRDSLSGRARAPSRNVHSRARVLASGLSPRLYCPPHLPSLNHSTRLVSPQPPAALPSALCGALTALALCTDVVRDTYRANGGSERSERSGTTPLPPTAHPLRPPLVPGPVRHHPLLRPCTCLHLRLPPAA